MYAVIDQDSPNYGRVLSTHRTENGAETAVEKINARIQRKYGPESYFGGRIVEVEGAVKKGQRIRWR